MSWFCHLRINFQWKYSVSLEEGKLFSNHYLVPNCRKMSCRNFENWFNNKTFMWKNIFDRDFSMVKWHGMRSLFSQKILEVWIFHPKCLKSTSNVTKDLPKVKTFESSKHFCRNSNFMIMDYLPLPCKCPYSKKIFGIEFLFFIQFPKHFGHSILPLIQVGQLKGCALSTDEPLRKPAQEQCG